MHKIQIEVRSDIIGNVFGLLDENIRNIEKAFGVQIINRSDNIVILSDSSTATGVEKAAAILNKLISFAEKGNVIQQQNVNYLIASLEDEDFHQVDTINNDMICLTVTGRPVRPKTMGQKKYVDQIRKNTIIFGVGPAGTGKTYLAMAMAVTAFKNNEVNRIILTRPAIEAGEKLGFLPGDLQQKVDPYLRPLYDALYEIMGSDAFQKNLERGLIEVAPLAYMRGRTLDNSFIVLDEAQNTTPEQMKMFLTRIGFNSKAVITGDITQIDLPEGKTSGMNDALRVLSGLADEDEIGISMLTQKDVVRHPLVQKIIAAYDKQDAKREHQKSRELRLKQKKRSRDPQ